MIKNNTCPICRTEIPRTSKAVQDWNIVDFETPKEDTPTQRIFDKNEDSHNDGKSKEEVLIEVDNKLVECLNYLMF